MALLNAEALAYIGRSSEFELACDAVEAGAVRRYAQAIMDDDPAYAPPEAGGGGLAPLLYPTHLFRRAWGTPDPIQDHASDPDFDGVADGIGATASQGLPDIPQLQGLRLRCRPFPVQSSTLRPGTQAVVLARTMMLPCAQLPLCEARDQGQGGLALSRHEGREDGVVVHPISSYHSLNKESTQ